jgi:hypothetical protein
MRYGNPSKKPRVIATLKGHSVEFPGRGTPPDPLPASAEVKDGITYVYVPPAIREEVASAGMLPESEATEPDEKEKPVRPEDPAAFKADMFRAFKKIVDRNDREDFTGTGIPKDAAMEKVLGYRITRDEMKAHWPSYVAESKQ